MARTRRRRPRLRAGGVLEFAFPELPRSLDAMRTGRARAPGMAVHLPRDYAAGRRFPALVYIEGGRGAPADRRSLAVPRRITRGRGYVAVALPLFKRELDAREPHRGLLIGAYDDYPLLARCYRRMLGRLGRAVPNLDWTRSAIGGFSNGAHATALLLSAVDRFVLSRFRDYYLIEGGLGLASLHKSALAGKNFLLLVGAKGRAAWRRDWLRSAAALEARAARLGRNLTLRRMRGVGHAFPAAAAPALRAWLRRQDTA